MIAAGLSAILFAALLSAIVFFTKGGMAMNNYFEMETQSRQLLEMFGRDVREASDAVWENTNTIRLSVDGSTVTYSYDIQQKEFVRITPSPQGQVYDILANSILDLKFSAFDRNGILLNLAGLPSGPTKMVQISLTLERESGAGPTNSLEIVSSRFLLRNKIIPAP